MPTETQQADPEPVLVTCHACGRVLDVDKGEAFPTDKDGVFCADHYPEA